jgi:glycosyltransferase involved in cell wall biosynthesis
MHEAAAHLHRIDVLYVITDLELGGVPLHLHRLALAMRERGRTVAVTSLAPPGPVGDRLRAAGIDVFSCEGRGGWDLRIIQRLTAILRRTQPAVIHSLLFHANLASRWAAQRAGFPIDRLVCEIQTVEVERRWHLWIDGLTYDLCRLTIGNSTSVVEHLATRASIPRDRLRLIRGGIDPAPIRAAAPIDRAALRISSDAPLLLWAGRLDPVKGLSFLIGALATVIKESGAHLCLAGGGPLRPVLEQQALDLHLNDRVHFLGPRPDVPSLLKAADVFVFPSRTEGLPNALLEAMAAACPIVTTDAPGCRDLIEHQRTGLRVPYGDTSALAGAILRLLRDRSLAAQLGANASLTVDRKWHVTGTYAEYSRLYAEVMRS